VESGYALPVMSALSCHLCAFAFVPSHSTCWFNASTVLDMLELFRLHFFQEKWASVVVKMLLEGISFVTRTAHLSKAFAFFLLSFGQLHLVQHPKIAQTSSWIFPSVEFAKLLAIGCSGEEIVQEPGLFSGTGPVIAGIQSDEVLREIFCGGVRSAG
jgi:hypothetical protein